jgi:hypothetical protein
VTDERCKHDLPIGSCAFCKPTPPGLTDRVYRTAGGRAFHRTESCTWLRKGQQDAERRDKRPHPVQLVDLVDAQTAALEPCLHCFDPRLVTGRPSGDVAPSGDDDAEPRAGSPWTAAEDERLVDGLLSGSTVAVLAERHGRTPGAIQGRLLRMIPVRENVSREVAADWLLERLRSSDYPWREVLESRAAARRTARAVRAGRARSTADVADRADHRPDHVLDVWQEVVGSTLSAERRAVFLARPEVEELRHHPDRILAAAAHDLYERHRELRLDWWAEQCARAALGAPVLDWSRLSVAHETAMAIRQIVVAAVAGLSSERRQLITARRLGLDGGQSPTLQAIGDALGISRERVRQLQDQALRELSRGHGNGPAQRLLIALRADAADADVDPGLVLLMLAQLGLPGGDVRLAVTVLALLTGDDREDADRLAGEAMALLDQVAATSTS